MEERRPRPPSGHTDRADAVSGTCSNASRGLGRLWWQHRQNVPTPGAWHGQTPGEARHDDGPGNADTTSSPADRRVRRMRWRVASSRSRSRSTVSTDMAGSAAFLSIAIIAGNQTFWASPEAITLLSRVAASSVPGPAAHGGRTAGTGAQRAEAVCAGQRPARRCTREVYAHVPRLDEHTILARSYWLPGSYMTSNSMSAGCNALPRFLVLCTSGCIALLFAQNCNMTSLRRRIEAPAQRQRRISVLHAGTAWGRLQREAGRWERPPVPGMTHQRPLASPRDCTRVYVACAVPLAHRAGQALHLSASSSKVGSGMPACQVGSRNSSRMPLGSKKYSSRPGKTPSFR